MNRAIISAASDWFSMSARKFRTVIGDVARSPSFDSLTSSVVVAWYLGAVIRPEMREAPAASSGPAMMR